MALIKSRLGIEQNINIAMLNPDINKDRRFKREPKICEYCNKDCK